ncbi:MAG: hypothetical protein HDT23_03745 [Ruminococcus sp.]|nr:hypothetical protein [Ruminococcus sp.]
MNNNDFRQHCINILHEAGVYDYEKQIYIVNPVIEKNKPYVTYDWIMKLNVLPKKVKLTFEQMIKIFTLWEGYYPCWIDITITENYIEIDTSLRMRKLKNTKTTGENHPFRIKVII